MAMSVSNWGGEGKSQALTGLVCELFLKMGMFYEFSFL
jgi:hypothetical protein